MDTADDGLYLFNGTNTVASGALSESNLEEMEKMFRQFLTEDGYPLKKKEPFWRRRQEPTLSADDESQFKYQVHVDYGAANSSAMIYSLHSYEEPTPKNMSKFKIGDILIPVGEKPDLNGDTYWSSYGGRFYRVTEVSDSGTIYGDWFKEFDDARSNRKAVNTYWYIYENRQHLVQLYSSYPTSPMGSVKDFARSMRYGEPDATFRKAQVMDNNGQFTEEAKAAFLEDLMAEDAKKDTGFLQKLAKAIVAEQESCKK